jgi:hypothetical protein
MERNVLDFKAVDERLCILRIKTKCHKQRFINGHALCQKVKEAYDIRPPNDTKSRLGD